MIHKRHKWGAKVVSKAKESSSVACIRCGCVRQYVGGIVTYFVAKEQTVVDKYAPVCDSDNMAAVIKEYDTTNISNPRLVSHYKD